MKNMQLPQTDSVRELALFWDTHDLTDFQEQLEEITEPIFERDAVLHIELQPEEAEIVQEIAFQKGIAADELVRQWVREMVKAP